MSNKNENISSNASIYKNIKTGNITIYPIDKAKYPINFSIKLEPFSTDVAEAFDINSNCYALIYKNSFAPNLDLIEYLNDNKSANVQEVLAFGKITSANTGEESLAVILKKISGVKISELLKANGQLSEGKIRDLSIPDQLLEVITFFNNENYIHGSINIDTIYFDTSINKLTALAPITHYTSFLQLPAFLPLNSLLTHPAARSRSDVSVDLVGFAVTILSLLSGGNPYKDAISVELVANIRIENGTLDSTITFAKNNNNFVFSPLIDQLFKGLLTDCINTSWGIEELKNWANKIDNSYTVASLHKESLYAFRFNDSEHVSRKSLAQAIFNNWNEARKSLKLNELSRWVSLSLKNPDMADKLTDLASTKIENITLTDEQIVRVLSVIDPDGPLRYKDISITVDGMATFVSYCYTNGERDKLQQVASVINDGIITHWENQQGDTYHKDKIKFNYYYDNTKTRLYLKKKSLGFGMERVLYDLNPTLPCQSELLTNFFTISIRDILLSLDKKSSSINLDDEEIGDPMDRHIGAYITSHISLEDEIKLKTMQNYPKIANNQQIIIIGLLTIAQAEINSEPCKNLTKLLVKRLSTLLDSLHSNKIKKELSTNLAKVAESGNIKSIFKIVANPTYARNDSLGFKKARKEYHALLFHIKSFQKQSNIEKLAYQLGLRIAVTISYMLCAITIIFVMFQSL